MQQCDAHCKVLLNSTNLQHLLQNLTLLCLALVQMALAKLKGMREAGLGIMQRLPDSVLADLLWKLSCNNQPADLLRTLKNMQRDDKYLARGPHNQYDKQGRSFLTAWLAAKPRASVQGFQQGHSSPILMHAQCLSHLLACVWSFVPFCTIINDCISWNI